MGLARGEQGVVFKVVRTGSIPDRLTKACKKVACWKASSVMEEKVRLVLEYEQDKRGMRELCEAYGIAREIGYVWLLRYRESGGWWN
jgi:hypothetical protein